MTSVNTAPPPGPVHPPAGRGPGRLARWVDTATTGRPAWLLTTVAGAGALTVLAVVDPNTPGHYPTCPVYLVTGLYCPGCGALRCMHALTQGDLPGALAMNALLVLVAPAMVWFWVRWGLSVFGLRRRRAPAPVWVVWLVLVVEVVYAVLRNLPQFWWLAPHTLG